MCNFAANGLDYENMNKFEEVFHFLFFICLLFIIIIYDAFHHIYNRDWWVHFGTRFKKKWRKAVLMVRIIAVMMQLLLGLDMEVQLLHAGCQWLVSEYVYLRKEGDGKPRISLLTPSRCSRLSGWRTGRWDSTLAPEMPFIRSVLVHQATFLVEFIVSGIEYSVNFLLQVLSEYQETLNVCNELADIHAR